MLIEFPVELEVRKETADIDPDVAKIIYGEDRDEAYNKDDYRIVESRMMIDPRHIISILDIHQEGRSMLEVTSGNTYVLLISYKKASELWEDSLNSVSKGRF